MRMVIVAVRSLAWDGRRVRLAAHEISQIFGEECGWPTRSHRGKPVCEMNETLSLS